VAHRRGAKRPDSFFSDAVNRRHAAAVTLRVTPYAAAFDRAPEDIKAKIYAAFAIQVLYRAPMKQANVWPHHHPDHTRDRRRPHRRPPHRHREWKLASCPCPYSRPNATRPRAGPRRDGFRVGVPDGQRAFGRLEACRCRRGALASVS
jgi:hypothetical protein